MEMFTGYEYRLYCFCKVSVINNWVRTRSLWSISTSDFWQGVYRGKEIAVKRLHQLEELDDKEFCNLSKVDHENVVKLLGYCHESRKTCHIRWERVFCYNSGANSLFRIYAWWNPWETYRRYDDLWNSLYITLFLAYVICSFVCFFPYVLQMTLVILIGPHVTKLSKEHVRV